MNNNNDNNSNNDNIKNILIGCPIRNRGWILPEYLTRLEQIDYPKDKLAFHFILNDSTDESRFWLENWKELNEDNYRYVKITEHNFNYPEDLGSSGNGRSGSVEISQIRHEYTYKALTELRNLLLDSAIEDEKIDYLFSIDSDILIKPDLLNKLINTKKDIISGLISNGNNAYNFFHINNTARGKIPVKVNEIFEVSMTGAVILISRNVFTNKNIRYSFDLKGEDIGFSQSATKEKFKLYVLNYLQNHVMFKKDLSEIVLDEIMKS